MTIRNNQNMCLIVSSANEFNNPHVGINESSTLNESHYHHNQQHHQHQNNPNHQQQQQPFTNNYQHLISSNSNNQSINNNSNDISLMETVLPYQNDTVIEVNIINPPPSSHERLRSSSSSDPSQYTMTYALLTPTSGSMNGTRSSSSFSSTSNHLASILSHPLNSKCNN